VDLGVGENDDETLKVGRFDGNTDGTLVDNNWLGIFEGF